MKSGFKIQSNNKNSFPINNTFENQFLSDVQSSQEQSGTIQQSQSKATPKKKQIINPNKNSSIISKIEPKKQENSKIIVPKGELDIQYKGKVDPQQKAIIKASNNIQKLSLNISQLKNQYNQMDLQQKLFKKRDQKKQKEIKEFLNLKKKEKLERQKKLKKIKQRQQKKRQQSLEILKQSQKKIIIKSQIKSKAQRQYENQERIRKEKQVQKYYEKYKDQKRFHQKRLEQDQIKANKLKQQYQAILNQHREKYKPIDEDDLQEHRRKHDQMIKNMEKLKRSQKQEKYRKIIQENQRLQNNIYRGQSYDIVLEELEQLKAKKKSPKKKYTKLKKYEKYVRENFLPRTHKKTDKSSLGSSLQKSNLTSRSHRQVKRYRFFQGMSYGQIVENRPLAKSQAEQRRLGNQYLLHLRNLPKKKKDPTLKNSQFSAQQLQILNEKLNNIAKVKKQRNPLYDHSLKKSLDIKLSQQPTRDELGMIVLQLKSKDQKIMEKQKVINSNRYGNVESLHQKRKQINQGIIDNIQRKLSLLAKL